MPDIIETSKFHDMDQYMETAAQFMDVKSIQLQSGSLYLENQVLQLNGITVTHFSSNLRLFQSLSIPSRQVMFVLTSPKISGCKWCGVDVPGNSLAILHPNREHEASLPPDWDSVEFLIDDKTIVDERLFSESMWRQTLQPQQALFARCSRPIRLLRQKLLHNFQNPERLRNLQSSKDAQFALRNKIIYTLRMALLDIENDGRYKPFSQSRRHKTFSRALAFIETNLEHTHSIQYICDQIGTTPRTLQLTFQELCGVTPSQFILSRKLHAIQQDIFCAQAAAIPICRKAEKYGMQHPGHFSQQYKRIFRESPRATVKRRIRN